ncbi:MAG: aminopeptidase P family protein [Oscillospiraceae bacterium]|nr:aminopeptidase P family protein [Oscillospiraceae bacterium]
MIKEHLKKVREHLKNRQEPAALIVIGKYNRRYLTGFAASSGYVLITPENTRFFTDTRYIEVAKKMLGGVYSAVELYPKEEAKKFYKELLEAENIKNIMYEENYISLKNKKHFDDLFEGFELVESGGLIEKMRQTKEPAELENIKTAQSITDKTFAYIINFISNHASTLTETDIAAELEYFMKKNGADDKAFDTICVSGKKSSRPHGEPENIKLSKGFLTLDFGARYNGYCSDMTRTVCLGSPSEKMREVYKIVLAAQTAALNTVRAGMESTAADIAARDLIRDAGYGDNFGHGLGHSVGLEVHENPGFAGSKTREERAKTLEEQAKKAAEDPDYKPPEKTLLPENTVISVEPGIYIEEEFGVRIEDLIVIKENGFLNLTKSGKELIII